MTTRVTKFDLTSIQNLIVNVVDQLEKEGKLELVAEVKKVNFPKILQLNLTKSMLETQLQRLFPELSDIRKHIFTSFVENNGLNPDNTFSIVDLLSIRGDGKEVLEQGLTLISTIRDSEIEKLHKIISGCFIRRLCHPKDTQACGRSQESSFRKKYLSFINACYVKSELKKHSDNLSQLSALTKIEWEGQLGKHLADFLFLGYPFVVHNKMGHYVINAKGKRNL